MGKKEEKVRKKMDFNSLQTPLSDRSFQVLKLIIDDLKDKYNLSYEQILSLIKEKEFVSEILIPISIFVKEISGLETICKYLKENLKLKYSKIASLLNRDHRTIWISYNNAVKKKKSLLEIKETPYLVPISLFTNRKFSVMEILVSYLKENYSLSFSQIAELLQRDQRNIWTIYSRYKKKK